MALHIASHNFRTYLHYPTLKDWGAHIQPERVMVYYAGARSSSDNVEESVMVWQYISPGLVGE